MNWKLIFSLSLFGLAMALGTVFLIPPSIEPVCWLVVFLLCAYLIARNQPNRHFLHGFLVSIVNSVWVTSAHVLFFSTYMLNHPREAAMTKSMPMPDSPRLMMVLVGPIVGIVTGLVLGLFAWIAGKLVKSTRSNSRQAASSS